MKKKYEHIKSNIIQHSLIITLNRPNKRNALNPKMINEIQEVFDINKKNNNIRVILIESSSNVFCAGADIEYLNKIKEFSYEDNLIDSKTLMKLFKTMLSYPKLIISKVCGAAMGGGCGIVTASDIIFATHNSKFGYPEVKIGFTPALVSTFLIQKINLSNTQELLLSGKIIDGEKAKKIGLVNFLFSEKDIHKKILQFVDDFATETSSDSIQKTKEILYSNLEIDKKLEQAAKFNADSRKNADFKKGITAFLNKKKINWSK